VYECPLSVVKTTSENYPVKKFDHMFSRFDRLPTGHGIYILPGHNRTMCRSVEK